MCLTWFLSGGAEEGAEEGAVEVLVLNSEFCLRRSVTSDVSASFSFFNLSISCRCDS